MTNQPNKAPVKDGLSIHATNRNNTKTFCGLIVTKGMSYHRDGIMKSMVIGQENICQKCLQIDEKRKQKS